MSARITPTSRFSFLARCATSPIRPATHGSSTSITLRLGPDCGSRLSSLPPELPLVGGGGESGDRGACRFDRTGTSDPGTDLVAGSGLRDGTDRERARPARAADRHEPAQGQRPTSPKSRRRQAMRSIWTPRRPSSTARPSRRRPPALKTQAYVSETDIEDKHWYRLRVGPFTTRAEAERVLQIALPSYPRAWLAINDEQTDLTAVEHAGVAIGGRRAARPIRRCPMISAPRCCAMRAPRSKSISTRKRSTC